MSSTALIEAIVDGVLTGGVYALMAAGLTLIFGVMDIINIAQGVMVILGAYLSLELSVHLGIGLLPGLLITVPAMFCLGVAVEFLFMRRLHDQDRTQMSILVTYAVAIVIEGILTAIFGVDYQQLQASYVNSSVHLLGFYLPDIYLIGFGLAVVLLGALYYMLYRTKFGRAVRASLQNRTAADLIGIDVNRVRAVSVGIGVAVTAVGGMGFGATNAFNPNTGYDLISRLLVIVILGGMGSIGGAMGAAVFLLVINDVVAVAWSPTWSPLVFFAALVVVLSVRPQGLFGRRAAGALGLIIVAVVFGVFPLVITDPTATSIAVFTVIFMVAAASWNIFSGYSGYLALGHAVFFGTGGYAVALAAQDWHVAGGWPVFILLPVGGIVAGLVAIPVGLVALRTRRHTFVVVTIAIFFIFQLAATNLGFTGGTSGILLPIAPFSAANYNQPFYYVALAILILTVLVSWSVRRS